MPYSQKRNGRSVFFAFHFSLVSITPAGELTDLLLCFSSLPQALSPTLAMIADYYVRVYDWYLKLDEAKQQRAQELRTISIPLRKAMEKTVRNGTLHEDFRTLHSCGPRLRSRLTCLSLCILCSFKRQTSAFGTTPSPLSSRPKVTRALL